MYILQKFTHDGLYRRPIKAEKEQPSHRFQMAFANIGLRPLWRAPLRMGPDTAPTKRLQKLGLPNVLVDCIMSALAGPIPEDTARGVARSKQLQIWYREVIHGQLRPPWK